MYIVLTMLLLAVLVTMAWKYDVKSKRNKDKYHVLRIHLEEIKAGKRSKSNGICAAYNHVYSGHLSETPFLDVMHEACKDWSHYSCDRYYPVASADGNSTTRAFDLATYSKSMWEGEYGRRRMELLDRMISICLIKSGAKK